MKILLIEDHKGLAQNLFDYLEPKGIEMDWANNGSRGYQLAISNDYDLIILDLSLPVMDGLEVCNKLRNDSSSTIPIIMLTARDTLEDKILGLDIGADDYLVKPFELKELYSRINSQIRRQTEYKMGFTLKIGDLTLNTKTLEVSRAGQALKIPPIPLKILRFLMSNSDKIVTGIEIEEHIWQDGAPISGALRTHLHTLRKNVDKPFEIQLIHTVPGQGYRIKS